MEQSKKDNVGKSKSSVVIPGKAKTMAERLAAFNKPKPKKEKP